MEWTDEAILLGTRRHGETAAVVTVLSRAHGRHAGLVRGGAGRRARAALQSGNRLQVTWRGRLAEQLGSFAWELLAAEGTRWLADAVRLGAVASACALVDFAFPERESHPRAYESLLALLAGLADAHWRETYARWELDLLAELGYGLDLSSCAVTGRNDELAYVSPRSGRAVSLSAGEAFRDRLLALPAFLRGQGHASADEIRAALTLTGYFLERRVAAQAGRPMPAARTRLVGQFAA